MASRSLKIEDALPLDSLRGLLRYDRETGYFWWLYPAKNRDVSKPAGFFNTNGYLVIRIGAHRYLAHRLAWFFSYGQWPVEVDHINRNRSDNRLVNLRTTNRQGNCRNSGGWLRSSTGIKNISRKRNSFQVHLFADGKNFYRRTFACLGQAVKARNLMLTLHNAGVAT